MNKGLFLQEFKALDPQSITTYDSTNSQPCQPSTSNCFYRMFYCSSKII